MRFDTMMPSPASSVAASTVLTWRLPIGRTYHELQLVGSGAGLGFRVTDLSEIRILLNSKVVQRFSGTDRELMNLYLGRDSATKDTDNFTLIIAFDRYNLITQPGETMTSIVTGSVDPATGRSINQFTIEVDIASSPNFTGTPLLKMYATQSENVKNKDGTDTGPGVVPYLIKSTRDFSAAGTYEISDLTRGGVSTQFIDQLFLIPSTSTLDNFVVEANQVKIFERTADLNERKQRDGVRVPQASLYVIDRTEHGYGSDPFDMRNLADWRLRLDTGALLTLKMYTSYLGALSD